MRTGTYCSGSETAGNAIFSCSRLRKHVVELVLPELGDACKFPCLQKISKTFRRSEGFPERLCARDLAHTAQFLQHKLAEMRLS